MASCGPQEESLCVRVSWDLTNRAVQWSVEAPSATLVGQFPETEEGVLRDDWKWRFFAPAHRTAERGLSREPPESWKFPWGRESALNLHQAWETQSQIQFSSVQSLRHVRLFATPWITACQASLFITISRSSLRLTSIESVMPSSHLILCFPLFLLPPIPPSIRVFSNKPTLRMRWPKPDYFDSNPKRTLPVPLPVSICISQSQRGRSYSCLVFIYCIEMSNFWLEAALWLEVILGWPVWQEWKVNSYDMLEFFLSGWRSFPCWIKLEEIVDENE